MFNINSLFSFALSGLPGFHFGARAVSTLNLTAISAHQMRSVFECWQFPNLVASAEKGIAGAQSLFLGSTANATYSIIPARFDGGIHNAPTSQIVVFTSGLVHVTLPNSTDEVWIQGGRYGTIIVVDTVYVSKFGHITTYPGDADTVAIEIPFVNGEYPNHKVLHQGPCTLTELNDA